VNKAIEEEIITFDIDKIDFSDEKATKELFRKLLNFIEYQAKVIQQQNAIIQQQSDEIARLKGAKGKPKIPPNVPPRESKQSTTEKHKNWSKGSKNPKIKIDRVVSLYIDPDILPPDTEYIGYEPVIIQNIKLQTDNVEYRRGHYYSKSQDLHYYAELPKEVQNTQFGSDLKALVATFYYVGRVTENKIHSILTDFNIFISEGQISNILTKEKSEVFSAEIAEIFQTGMRHANYFQSDSTGARHMGKNGDMHYIGNEEFSTYYIEENRKRETIRRRLELLDGVLIPTPMVTDSANQYDGIACHHGHCWLHEIRHYTKMKPYLDYHRSILEKFITNLWEFYDLLKKYKSLPNIDLRREIEQKFESLFTTTTGYFELDRRIALTYDDRDKLLMVLDFPEIPLHNNGSEIAVREGVLKRKISYGTRSELGKAAWENMLSILDTCRKQKVSFYMYINDIYSNKFSMPRLADMIPNAR
jgi:hypothetical protein